MTVTVTGATGHLGRLVVAELLDRGVPAGDVVAAVRSPERAADLADLGVQVRHADYDQPETLKAAFADTDRLAFISNSDVANRATQHRNVVEAAQAAGVGAIVYTSILKADTSGVSLAPSHLATEQLLAGSGLPHTFLRNSWYLENYLPSVPSYLEQGAIVGAAGDGKVAAASRADYAAAVAAVLTSDGHDGATYELGGQPFTMTELAQTITAVTGTQVAYTDVPADELSGVLVDAGLPEEVAAVLADADRGIANGDLTTDSGDLARLLGRPPVSMRQAVSLVAP